MYSVRTRVVVTNALTDQRPTTRAADSSNAHPYEKSVEYEDDYAHTSVHDTLITETRMLPTYG